jgi:hypothetical protein
VASHRRVGGDVRFSQSFRVRMRFFSGRVSVLPVLSLPRRDFFPVILTFLRQLPFIGTFLNLPYIRPVRHPPSFFSPGPVALTHHPLVFQLMDRLAGSRTSVV